MKFCTKCGTELADDARFCADCGQPVNQEEKKAENGEQYTKKIEDAVTGFVNTKDETESFDSDDINNNKVLALFSYLGLLFLIPLLAAPNSKYAKFHVNQGLILFVVEIVIGIAGSIITTVFSFFGVLLSALAGLLVSILGLACTVFAIIGIVNAVQGKAKELPLIGSFRFIK